MAEQTEAIRLKLIDLYQSKKWTDRVKQMSDSQVHAVYNRLKLKNAIK